MLLLLVVGITISIKLLVQCVAYTNTTSEINRAQNQAQYCNYMLIYKTTLIDSPPWLAAPVIHGSEGHSEGRGVV